MARIIINADDFGLSDGICSSILKLFECKAVSNTTIMIAADGAEQRCETFGIQSIARLAGVHLQLTDGRPISPPVEVQSLIDKTSGRFLKKDSIPRMRPQEVELEWGRQIERVSELLGCLPTHLDSHHGAHRVPSLTPVYLRLAKRFGLPVRGGTAIGQIQTGGTPSSTLVLNRWTGRGNDREALKRMILDGVDVIGPNGVLEIVTHPGFNDRVLEAISTLNRAREGDHTELILLAKENWLADNGISLVRYPDLRIEVG
jgi:chitin disaccharide deacetylase